MVRETGGDHLPLPLLALTLATAAFAGSLLPSMALLVNDKDNAKSVDPAASGYIGLAYPAGSAGSARMDLKNLANGDKFRIRLNPSFTNSISFGIGPLKIAEKKLAKHVVSDAVVLQQVPPGSYLVTHFYPDSKSSGVGLANDTLVVEAGKITSLGSLTLKVEMVPLVGPLKSASIRTSARLSDSAFAAFAETGLHTLPVVHHSVGWATK